MHTRKGEEKTPTSTTSNFHYKNTETNCNSGKKRDNEWKMYENTARALSQL